MKHLVQIKFTEQAGHALEKRPGGPGPCIGRLIERFKPEAVYMSPSQRATYMVCDLEPADMAELMLAGSALAGRIPDFIPVVSGGEFSALAGKATAAANKLVEG